MGNPSNTDHDRDGISVGGHFEKIMILNCEEILIDLELGFWKARDPRVSTVRLLQDQVCRLPTNAFPFK